MIITLKNSQTGKKIALMLLGISLLSYSPFFLPLGNSFKKNFIQNNNLSDSTINKNRLLEEDYFLYKNGEEMINKLGENYILHDNQWLRIPSEKEYEKILKEVPLVLRYFIKPRRSTQTYDQIIQMEAGGDTMLNSLRNGNDFSDQNKDTVPSSSFLNAKSNAMLHMQDLMNIHDGFIEHWRKREKQRKKYEEKRKQTLREWGLED